MEVKAQAKTVRIAPRKVRLVIDLIRGKDVKEAAAILEFTNRGASPAVAKVLKSAVANAVHNNGMDENKLYVKACYVDEGIVLKRQHGGARETFTVRKTSNGVGVEKTWPLHSPHVEKIEIVRFGKVRRAKLNYLRQRTGKSAKVKELVR